MDLLHNGEAMPTFEDQFCDAIRLVEGGYTLLAQAMMAAEKACRKNQPGVALADLWTAETVIKRGLEDLLNAKGAYNGEGART